MATVEAPFDQVKILVGDGEASEAFTELCLVNLSRSMTFTNNMQDDEIPDCADVTKPAGIKREVRSTDFEISGEGKLHVTNLAMMLAWWQDAEKKNIRVEVGPATSVGQRISGAFYLSSFELTGAFKETATASVSFMPVDTRDLVIAALA